MSRHHSSGAVSAWLTCFLPVLWGVSASSADVTVTKDGRARAAIYVPAAVMEDKKPPIASIWRKAGTEAGRQRLRESVKDLSHYLQQISGAEVQIVLHPPQPGDKRLPILIGELAIKKFGPPKFGPPKFGPPKFGPPKKHAPLGQGFRMVVSPEGIGLMGESDLGTSYAIYEVLDRLGCRWYMPSDMGEVIPSTKMISLKEVDYSSAPYTIYRGIWYADNAFGRRNRLGGLELRAGHALEGYVTPKDRQEHPEWVGTVDGKPQRRRLRWSAPGLAEAIGDRILTRLEKAPETLSFSLSPDDGMGYDNSEQDRALDAGDFDPSFQGISITDRQVWFCNRIVRRVTAKYPDVLFGMLAYAVSTRPPVREKLHRNLVPQIAPITYSRAHPMTDAGEPNNKDLRELVKGWGKASTNVSYYFYGYFLAEPSSPNPYITKWSVDIPIIYKHNCRFWQPETITNFETTMHAHYLGMRLAWDPTGDPQEIIAELHRRFYGSAAKEMAAYWHFIDHVWVDTPEYSGCGFGHLRRFTPERMTEARRLMDRALAAAKTPAETFRIKMADDSLRLFELFMKLRRDLAEGRFENLASGAKKYRQRVIQLADKYQPQYAFGRMFWTGKDSIYGRYFAAFYQKTYDDAARIAREAVILGKPLRTWRYRFEKQQQGEAAGWSATDFDDTSWKTTDVCVETWSTLGHHNDMGSMWYRKEIALPELPAGKKVFLWLGSTDGSAKLFVNGKHVPYRDAEGKPAERFSGYCQPASFDVTAAIHPSQRNQIAILCTRTFLNELGTGGLLGPVVIYREKD